jgi:uncharacterized damage-inducible protein DinB
MGPQPASEAVAELLLLLHETRGELHFAVRDLSENDACACPAPGRWSVLQCIEHLTIVEQIFLGRLQNAERAGAPPIDKQREAELLARVSSRGQRVEAPEPVRPAGRFATLSEALQAFDAARAETVRFTEAQQADLYMLSSAHPRFGPLNGYECVLIVAAHGRRHTEQAREARAALGQQRSEAGA